MKLRQRTLVYLVAALMVAACVSSVEAQGRRGGAQGGRGGFGQGGPGGPGGMGGGFGRGGSSEVQLLQMADVQKELDLLDDQIAECKALAGGNDMRTMFQSLQDVPQEERAQKMQDLMADAQKKTEAKINDILLPHQATRLKQLSLQFAMQGRGGVTSSTVAEQLGITDEQRTQLQEKSRKLQEEMQKKLQEELIKELTPAQQAKLKQLVGAPFTFEQPAPPQFGGRGGAPGAPGAAGAAGGRRRGN